MVTPTSNNPPTWEVSFREEDHKALYIEKFGEKMLYWWCPTCKAEEENCKDPKCNKNHCPDCEYTNREAIRDLHRNWTTPSK